MVLSLLGEGDETIFSEFAPCVLQCLQTLQIAIACTLDDERRLPVALSPLVILQSSDGLRWMVHSGSLANVQLQKIIFGVSNGRLDRVG